MGYNPALIMDDLIPTPQSAPARRVAPVSPRECDPASDPASVLREVLDCPYASRGVIEEAIRCAEGRARENLLAEARRRLARTDRRSATWR